MTQHAVCCSVLTFLSISTALFSEAEARERPVRTVLAIHWGGEDFPSTPVVDGAIRETLASDPNLDVDYFAEFLESDRFEANGSLALRDYIRRKYQGRRIDLVIAVTGSALEFVLAHRSVLFPGAPVIFTSLTAPDERIRAAGAGITGMIVGTAHEETLKLALTLHPSTEQVFVVAESDDAQSADSVRLRLPNVSSQVRLTYIAEPTVPGLLDAIKAIPPRSLVLYIWHAQEKPGKRVYSDAVARVVAQASPVPVYGTSDFYLGSGVVGGVVRSTRETGTRVGEMARQILAGKRAQEIPIENARVVPTFDWRQLQRWRIDSVRLPKDAVVQFRSQSTWETYRPYILGTAAIISVQLMLIVGLLMESANRRRAETALRLSESVLRQSFERNRQLTGRLITAQEEARANIARDLHDDVCQDLVGVAMEIESLKSEFGDLQDPRTDEALNRLRGWAVELAQVVRRLSHGLHPATLQLLGLTATMKGHCVEVEKRHDVQVSFKSSGNLDDLHPDVALCLFRIAQEALRNAAVHGSARRLGVSVARSGAHIVMKVVDDGCGFDVEAAGHGDGMGLAIMVERAHLANGHLQVFSRPGKGTLVLVRVQAAPRIAEKPAPVERHASAPQSQYVSKEAV